jgi:trigger factor
VEAEFREAALDAAVEGATIEVPDALIEARAREMWDSMLHSLSHQGIDRATYLRLSGTTEEETIEKAKPDADVALRREAVLAAIAEAESLEPTEEEMLEAVTEAAGPERVKPEKLLERLRKNGRLDSLKDDLSQRKAWDIVVDSAKPVPAGPSDS